MMWDTIINWGFLGYGLALVVASVMSGLREKHSYVKIFDDALLGSIVMVLVVLNFMPLGFARSMVNAVWIAMGLRLFWRVFASQDSTRSRRTNP